jgi:hypothetical protein
MDAQHLGGHLLPQREGQAMHPILQSEQPAGEALRQRMPARTGSELIHHGQSGAHIAPEEGVTGITRAQQLPEARHRHLKDLTGDLHPGTTATRLTAKHNRQPHHALIPHQEHIHRQFPGSKLTEGDHPAEGEREVGDGFLRFIEHMPEGEGDPLHPLEEWDPL